MKAKTLHGLLTIFSIGLFANPLFGGEPTFPNSAFDLTNMVCANTNGTVILDYFSYPAVVLYRGRKYPAENFVISIKSEPLSVVVETKPYHVLKIGVNPNFTPEDPIVIDQYPIGNQRIFHCEYVAAATLNFQLQR